jgi:hypothetical protein
MTRPPASVALTDAREAVSRYADAWKRHKSHCDRCNRSVHARGREPCPAGRSLLDGRQAAELLLEVARRADAEPVPGQGAIF